MPTISDLYGTFLYGEAFYGVDTLGVRPKAPENLYVIREPDYNIIKWDAVQYNTDGTVCTPVRYAVYRTDQTNGLGIIFIKDITTLDYSGNVDTCYVDQLTGTDLATDFQYQVLCLGTPLVPGIPTEPAADIFINKNMAYENTGVYTRYKNNAFYKLLEDIPYATFFDTESNILPYVTNCGYVLVDFFPAIAAGTVLSLWVNDVNIGSNYNRKVGEFFYCTIPNEIMPYSSSVKIEVTDNTTVLKTYYFKTYNYLTFLQTLASQLEQLKLESASVRNDLYKNSARLNKIYDHFGFPFGFTTPAYLNSNQYRNLIVGDGDIPGLYSSFLNSGGTYKGISDAVRSITGVTPAISTYRDEDGWVLQDNVVVDSGTASAITTMTLSDASKSWAPDTFIGDMLEITDITAIPNTQELRRIIANTGTQITITGPNLTVAAHTYTYIIYSETDEDYILEFAPDTNMADTSGTSSGSYILTDTLKSWYNDMWKNCIVTIVSGTGALQQKTILSNTSNTLTVDVDWDIPLDSTSVYAIQQVSDHDISVFSIPYQLYTLKVTVYNGLRDIVRQQLSSTGTIDYLDATYIISGVTISTYSGHVFTQNVDFIVDNLTGKITWISVDRPTPGMLIYCEYTFIMRDLIVHVINLIKEAHYRVVVEFWTAEYGFGVPPFGLYPFGAI